MIFDSFDLSGRAALITGAGRGIGRAIAHALAEAGCAVAIQDLQLEVAQAAALELPGGTRALALGGDIADTANTHSLVEQTAAAFGSFDILINNAAIQQPLHWTELQAEDALRQLNANVVTPIALCQAAAVYFKRQQWGRILNIGSIQGLKGNASMLPYSASKAAIENLTRALARDLAREGVTVNCLSPGYFDTWRNRAEFPDAAVKVERGKIVPVGRIGEPEDCAALALLLCSEAGSYITGQTILVDGGLSLR